MAERSEVQFDLTAEVAGEPHPMRSEVVLDLCVTDAPDRGEGGGSEGSEQGEQQGPPDTPQQRSARAHPCGMPREHAAEGTALPAPGRAAAPPRTSIARSPGPVAAR